MTKKIFLIIFCFITAFFSAKGQEAGIPKFFRQTEKVNFNLPQFGLSLSLPPQTGLMVPVVVGRGVSFKLGEETFYFLNTDYLYIERTGTFRFALSDDESSFLQMQIAPASLLNDMSVSEWVKHTPFYNKTISPISTDLGESVSFRSGRYNEEYDSHVYLKDNYLIIFSLPTNIANKDEYMQLIYSLKAKDFHHEKIKYETLSQSGYYDKENINTFVDPVFGYKEGRTTRLTGFEIPMIELSLEMPKNFKFQVEASKIEYINDYTLELQIAEEDAEQQSSISGIFASNDLSFIYRYNKEKNAEYVIEHAMNASNIVDRGNVVIDGIRGKGVLYNSTKGPTLDIYFDTDSVQYWFSFYGIKSSNIAIVDEVVSSIRINNNSPRNGTSVSRPVSSVFRIKE